jgi:hypothetical protein
MPSYHEPLKMPADREAMMRAAFAADDNCISVGGLAVKVAAVEKRHDDLLDLANEMVATLLMERNVPVVHPDLKAQALIWQDRLRRIDSRTFCEHGIADGDYCETCNKAYKKAAAENGQ